MGARVVRNDAKGLIESYRLEEKNGASTSSARTDLGGGLSPPPFALSLSKGRPSYAPALSGADHARAFLGVQTRSEEHTSELQSLMRHSYAVFRWKKKKPTDQISHNNNRTQ